MGERLKSRYLRWRERMWSGMHHAQRSYGAVVLRDERRARVESDPSFSRYQRGVGKARLSQKILNNERSVPEQRF
jgi:hypothetical protein